MVWRFSKTDIYFIIIIVILLGILGLVLFNVLIKRKKEGPTNKHQPNLYAAARDVFTAAIAKGQFALACITLVIVVLLWKMTHEEISLHVTEMTSLFKSSGPLGWLILVGAMLAASYSIRRIKTAHAKEVKLLENDNQALQIRIKNLVDESKPATKTTRSK